MIRHATRGPLWIQEEDNILQKLYATGKQEEIMALIPKRTWKAIRRRAKQLNLSRGWHVPPLNRLPSFNPSEKTKTWLAAVIDCDGCIALNKHHVKERVKGFTILPQVRFCNTNIQIAQRFRKLTFQNDSSLATSYRHKNNPKWRDKYSVYVSRTPLVYALLSKIKDDLIVKRKQAELVLEFIEIEDERMRKREKYGRPYTQRELEIWEEMKKLNA